MRPEIYWIPSPWPGRLAILPHPRGEDWLEDEIAEFRRMGVDLIVSALEKAEEALLELTRERELCQSNGIEFISFPIADGTAPTSEKAVGELVQLLETRLAAGKNVAIHCRAGIGRCVVLATCTLALAGVEPETAFQKMRQARGCHVPDKKEQEEWVKRFAEKLTSNNRKPYGT